MSKNNQNSNIRRDPTPPRGKKRSRTNDPQNNPKKRRRGREELDKELEKYLAEDKRKESTQSEPEHDIAAINTLADLIVMAESGLKYRNIDNAKLRAIAPGVKKLNEMKGLDKIKETILGQIIYYLQELHKNDDDYMHTVITGGPGVGKTSLAEILATIYCHLGLLSTGKINRVHRKDLIGKWCGHTANMTEEAVKAAFGGVLLIDEAYSIGGRPDHVDTFAKECVDTLNQCLSEYKKEFVCIIVGYKESLDNCFFKINEGLERRFAWRFDMGEAPLDALADIFRGQAMRAGWDVSPDAIPRGFFKKNKDLFKMGGGATEVLLSKCKMAYSYRMFGRFTLGSTPTITNIDFKKGFEEFKRNRGKSRQTAPPPLGMYT